MLNIIQFRELIVKSALNDLLMYSKEAEELLVFTCAVESQGGTYIKQIDGNAFGIYQMEPTTHNDIWRNFILLDNNLGLKLFSNFDVNRIPHEERLMYDLRYATAMTRLFYARIKQPLPSSSDVEAIWKYYKRYYNTFCGKAVRDESISKYHDFLQRQR